MTMLIATPAPRLPDGAAADVSARAPWPELPALQRLLDRGRRLPDARDWRDGVLAGLVGAPANVAPVAVASRALPQLSPGTSLCFAAPVHLIAGISRVHLPPGGRLLLDLVEEQAWCASFNQEFGSPDLQLHIVAPGGGWVLQAPFAHAARDAAPEALVGEALARHAAGDEHERQLRRFGSELEMWLAAHALNREREARRVPVLNAIWFWDGGCASAVPAPTGMGCVFSAGACDAWLAGLARHAGVAVAAVAHWDEAMAGAPRCRSENEPAGLIVLAPADDVAGEAFWLRAESQWFAPAAAALDRGVVTGLRVQIGPRAWRTPDRSALRWFRSRRRSWWQRAGDARP